MHHLGKCSLDRTHSFRKRIRRISDVYRFELPQINCHYNYIINIGTPESSTCVLKFKKKILYGTARPSTSHQTKTNNFIKTRLKGIRGEKQVKTHVFFPCIRHAQSNILPKLPLGVIDDCCILPLDGGESNKKFKRSGVPIFGQSFIGCTRS